MRVARLIICIGLLSSLLGASLVGCATSQQPTWSLERWERERNRVKSRE